MTRAEFDPETGFEVSRVFKATPERIFQAWLSPEYGAWMSPPGAWTRLDLIEPHVGGRFDLTMHMPNGDLPRLTGEYVEIDAPRRIHQRWSSFYGGGELTIIATVTPEAGGSRLTVLETGFPDRERTELFRAGWEAPDACFDKLEKVLST